MSLDDPTANDDALIDDDLVASLGFQPSPSEGAVSGPAADTKTAESSEELEVGADAATDTKPVDPLVELYTPSDDSSGEVAGEGLPEGDTDLVPTGDDIEVVSGPDIAAVGDVGLIDLAGAEEITLVDTAEAVDEIVVSETEPEAGSDDEPLFGSGEAIELPADSDGEVSIENSDDSDPAEEVLESPELESEGSEAETEASGSEVEASDDASDPELLDPDEARSVATAFAELDEVEPFDFDSEVDGSDLPPAPDGQDLDDLDVPLDLDAPSLDVEPGSVVGGAELLDAPTESVARVGSDSEELLDEVFAEPEAAGAAPVVAAVATAPTAPLTDPSSGTRRRRKLRARKVRRVIRHVDPWSVLTFSVLFHLVFFLSMLLASILVWNGAVRAGTIDNIENFIRELGDYETFNINSDVVFRAAVVIAGMLTLASSVLVVLLTVVFNLVSDLVGGIRVTVVEEDTVVVVPSE